MKATRLVCISAEDGKLGGIGVENAGAIDSLAEKKFGKGESFVLDFGEHCTGYFSIDIGAAGSHMDSPLFLAVKFAELPLELADEGAGAESWLSTAWIQEERIHLDSLPTRLELPRRYSFRYAKITVIDTSAKWRATFSNATVRAVSSAPENLEARIGDVADEKLRQICRVSAKTLAECMQSVFEDGPKRDRRLWIGDLRLQALSAYSLGAGRELVKRCLYLFAALRSEDGRIPACVFTGAEPAGDDTFLFDYSLFFVCALADFFAEFGFDGEMFRDFLSVCRGAIDAALKYVDENGKLTLDEKFPAFIDWGDDYAKNSAGEGVLIYSLKKFLDLLKNAKNNLSENFLDQNTLDYAKTISSLAAKIENHARKSLFDEEAGLFCDFGKSGEKEYPLAAQIWFVLADVLSPEENKKLMSRVIEKKFPVRDVKTPYMYHHIAEAIFHAGFADAGADFVKSYWGAMIDAGADTFWEAFCPENPAYSPYGTPSLNSYCHAWSCTPVYLVRKYLEKNRGAL